MSVLPKDPDLVYSSRGQSARAGLNMDSAAGEPDGTTLRVTFDPRLEPEFHDSKVTSDAARNRGELSFRATDQANGAPENALRSFAEPAR